MALTKGGFSVIVAQNNAKGAQPQGIHVIYAGGKRKLSCVKEFSRYQNTKLDWINVAQYVKIVGDVSELVPWGISLLAFTAFLN